MIIQYFKCCSRDPMAKPLLPDGQIVGTYFYFLKYSQRKTKGKTEKSHVFYLLM